MRPTITGIAHVELSVSDVDTSVSWYCRVLGAKDVWRGRNDEGAYRACAIREQTVPRYRSSRGSVPHEHEQGLVEVIGAGIVGVDEERDVVFALSVAVVHWRLSTDMPASLARCRGMTTAKREASGQMNGR